MAGYGDGPYGTMPYGGERVGATYLTGTTTLSGGTTTWTDERIVSVGATLRFDPAASSTLLVMDNKNLIVYGTLDMKQPDAAKTMTARWINVDEQAFVGAPVPNDVDNMGTMVPSTTDIGCWVEEQGIFDVIGAPKVAWNRTGDDSTWLSTDDMKTTPFDALDYTTFAAHTKGGVLKTVSPGNGVTYTQEAFNLTRNIRFEGTSGHRAHVLIMTPNITQVMKWCSFEFMGPRKILLGGDTAKIRGRWAGVHFHHLMDSVGSLAEGVVVKNGGSHAFVPHDSNNVTFKDCIAYRTVNDQYWWDNEQTVRGTFAPNQLSLGVTYDHCMAASALVGVGDGEPQLASFLLHAFSGTAINCVAVGSQGYATSAGFIWPEFGQSTWTTSNNTSHNNAAFGLRIWQNTTAGHEVFSVTSFRNGTSGIANGAYVNNYHHSDHVAFQNAGSGDESTDFMSAAGPRTFSPPNHHQVIQDCWFGDYGVIHHVAGTLDGNKAIVRNNHLGHVRVDEWRGADGHNFMHSEFDFIENDCEQPEDWCNQVHPHAGNHTWIYAMNGVHGYSDPKPAFDDPVPSVFRVQRADGTAFQLKQVGTSNTDFTAVTIPAFAFVVPAQSLNQATQGQPYSDSLVYSPGTGNSTVLPVTWALRAGSGPLPPGLSLSAAGDITGTPTSSGTFPITVQAVDASKQRARRTISLVVGSSGVSTVTPGLINGSGVLFAPSVNQVALPPPSITTVALDRAEVGDAYSFQMAVTGGKQPFVWSIITGTLPAGISFSASGAFSGTPTSAGTPSLGIRITDALGKFDTVTLPLQVMPTVSVSAGALPDAVVGRAYSHTFTAQDGIAPYTFSPGDVLAMPEGMTISSAGVLSGTPIFARTYHFSVVVVDAVGMIASGLATLTVGVPFHRVGRALALRGAPRYVSAR